MALEPSDLSLSLSKIAEEVFEHCQHGAQSEGIVAIDPQHPVRACGQFYGNDVRNRGQRGLHGTAAAVGILLSTRKGPYVDEANRLLNYVNRRMAIEQGAGVTDLSQIIDDESNTIKQSELLASINSLASDPSCVPALIEKIFTGQDATSGAWGFFLDEKISSNIATCYAVLGLHDRVLPEKLQKAWKYLWDEQNQLTKRSEAFDVDAIARRSLILYTLIVSATDNSPGPFSKKELVATITSLWRHCQRQYEYPFEVTIEYHRGSKNHYVRIPWQIYLAHALLRANSSYFYSIRFQQYISALIQRAVQGGYAYSQAGPFLSTRTNHILYEFLSFASTLEPRVSVLFRAVDRLGEYWANDWVRMTSVTLIGLCGLKVSNMMNHQLLGQSSIVSNVIASVFIMLLCWLYSKGNR